MNRPEIVLFSILFLTLTVGLAGAQTQTARGEVVLFSLDATRAGSDFAVFADTDGAIRDVLATIGQFQVTSMAYHLGGADLAEFVDAMRREANGSAYESAPLRVGGQLFGPADAARIKASSLVVIPSVADMKVTREVTGLSACDVMTSFAFIALTRPHPLVRISIDTHGRDNDRAAAIKEAVEAIPPRLVSVLNEVPYLRSNWGIIDVRGNEVVLELGRDAGIRRGDEFVALPPDGTREKGLLMVRQVDAITSVAVIVYSDSPIRVGDRLLDLARFGTDSTVYIHSVLIQPGPAPGGSTPLIGLRQSFSRGFYLLRPFVGIEVPFNLMAAGAPGVPINLYAGGEYDILMGRLQLVPRAAIGLGAFTGLAGSSPDVVSHVGGSLSMAASYLLTRDVKAEIETGWLTWSGFSGYSYGGAFLGGGLTVKY